MCRSLKLQSLDQATCAGLWGLDTRARPSIMTSCCANVKPLEPGCVCGLVPCPGTRSPRWPPVQHTYTTSHPDLLLAFSLRLHSKNTPCAMPHGMEQLHACRAEGTKRPARVRWTRCQISCSRQRSGQAAHALLGCKRTWTYQQRTSSKDCQAISPCTGGLDPP